MVWYEGNNGVYGNENYGTKPVGTKSPNELGLYDMSGNVYEACWDFYSDSYYNNGPVSNPTGPNIGTGRVQRGGGWMNIASQCRVTGRNNVLPRYDEVFRRNRRPALQ